MAIYIIDNYDSFTFNLFQLIQSNTSEEVVVVRNDKISCEELKALKPSRIVLSPGPGHPSVDGDFGVCKDIVQRAAELNCPVLGVCLGHQGMAAHLGGSVVRAPQIVHGKTSMIDVKQDTPLFKGLGDSIKVMRYHSLVVEKAPADFVVTATEQVHGLIMAMQHKSLPVYGVQFHPESIGTPDGQQMIRNFLAVC